MSELTGNKLKFNKLVGAYLNNRRDLRSSNELGAFVMDYCVAKTNQSVPKQMGTDRVDDIASQSAYKFMGAALEKVIRNNNHDENSNYYPLISKILKNTTIDEIRSQKVLDGNYMSANSPEAHASSSSAHYGDEELHKGIDDLPDEFPLEEYLLVEEAANKIREIISQVKGKQRQVLHMHLIGGFTFYEISERLGFAESTIKTRYYAALKQVRDTAVATEYGFENILRGIKYGGLLQVREQEQRGVLEESLCGL